MLNAFLKLKLTYWWWWSSPSSHDYSFIVSGSEDKYVYIWSTYHDLSKFTSVRRDRNDFWEGIKGEYRSLNQAWASYSPGTTCGPLRFFLIGPLNLKE